MYIVGRLLCEKWTMIDSTYVQSSTDAVHSPRGQISPSTPTHSNASMWKKNGALLGGAEYGLVGIQV